jgi:hypothetical protein
MAIYNEFLLSVFLNVSMWVCCCYCYYIYYYYTGRFKKYIYTRFTEKNDTVNILWEV